jgi:RNA polymerase sigma factor (sigma-70 family)
MEDTPVITALVEAALKGDQGAWKSLVDRYTPLMAAVINRFRLSRSDAEDVVQTVWLRLVEHLGDLREPRAMPKWIVVTTRNECIRVVRMNRRAYPFDPINESEHFSQPDGVDLEAHLVEVERHQLLLAAIAELPDHHRNLLLLLIADPPIPYAEIAKRLGIPRGSIGPTRARALDRLRDSLVADDLRQSGGEPGASGGGEA